MSGAAPVAPVLGFLGKLYYNAGTYGSPTWTIVKNVGDTGITMEADEAETNVRAGLGFASFVAGLIKLGIEFVMVWDPADSAQQAFLTAFLARTPIELLMLDDLQTNTGSQGIRVTCMISKFNRTEKLGEAMMAELAFKPTYNDNAAPAWYVAA